MPAYAGLRCRDRLRWEDGELIFSKKTMNWRGAFPHAQVWGAPTFGFNPHVGIPESDVRRQADKDG